MSDQNQPNETKPNSPLVDKSQLSADNNANGAYLCYWQNVGYNSGDTTCIEGRLFVCESNGWVHYGDMCESES